MHINKKIIIIAEVGWNHMGDMDLAAKMIEAAAGAGADIVKFQSWSVKNLHEGPWDSDGRRQIYEKAELTRDRHVFLSQVCRDNKVVFMSSCFDAEDVDKLHGLTTYIKIPSTEITNQRLLQRIVDARATKGEFNTVVMSTGASTLDEIKIAYRFLQTHIQQTHLLHCVSQYPCDASDARLDDINELKYLMKEVNNWHKGSVGYSGHCIGINDAIAAIGVGAKIIEKHFTLDNDLPGRDNKFAILPDDLKRLCEFRTQFEQMTCHSLKRTFTPGEIEARTIYRGRWSSLRE